MTNPKRITYILQSNNLNDVSKLFQTTENIILSENPHLKNRKNFAGAIITVCPGSVHPDCIITHENACCGHKAMMLRENMLVAWLDHIYWTRMLLISIAHNLPDKEVTQAKLLTNPKQTADIFMPYYGAKNAKNIEELLTEHLVIGGQIMNAAKKGDNTAVTSLSAEWYKNADKIADAFSSLNPYYKEDEVKKMMYEHLALTTAEVVNRISGNYAQDIKDFQKVENEVIMMANFFTNGLIKQFPEICK